MFLNKIKLWQKLRDMPVAVKVTAWYTLFMAIIFVVVVVFTAKFTENFRIQAAAATLQKQVDDAARHPDKFDDHEDDVYIASYNNKNIKIKGKLPASLMQELPPMPGRGLQKFKQGGKEFWYYDVEVPQRAQNGPRAFEDEHKIMRGVIALDKINQRTNLFLLGLFFGLPFFIIIAALGGYRIIKRGFAPVRAISATAQSIGETSDLSSRIDIGPGGDEIHQMANSFNTMLTRLETSVEREKRFSADVSHELRTPVAVIMAESEYGRDCTTSVEEAKEGFISIHKQSQKMTALINQLLELARLGNKANIERKPLDFSQLVTETCNDYKVLASTKGFTLEALITPALTVNGNASLLQRILANYLDNAFKFTQSVIKVTLSSVDNKVRLSVADDGPGLTAEQLKHIWDRFYQADTSRNKESNAGLGLGLATVAAIAKLHGGKVWAESNNDGKGSIFYLEI
jgi:signal transduction histidine kinase